MGSAVKAEGLASEGAEICALGSLRDDETPGGRNPEAGWGWPLTGSTGSLAEAQPAKSSL